MTDMPGLERHIVFGQFEFFSGTLPPDLIAKGKDEFEMYWNLHPAKFHEVRQPGRGIMIPLPRWQQAYDKPYKYTGTENKALDLPPVFDPYLELAQTKIDPRLNGTLLNWYDAARDQYIGPHHDSRSGLVPGSPIVTISLGATRGFRLSRREEVSLEFCASHGSVFIMPWHTNLMVKHEVPKPRNYECGRRISITFRAFLPSDR